MKIGVVGSRGLIINDMDKFIPSGCTEIISGGAVGVDKCAADYARKNNIKLTEILPDYKSYGRGAPLVRNKAIVERADMIIAFWDGRSRGTAFVINYANKINKPCKIISQGAVTFDENEKIRKGYKESLF